MAKKASRVPTVKTLLVRLEAWFAKKRPRYLAGLRKGATAVTLAALEKILGQPLPSPLRQWLTWHDGQDENLIGAFKEAFNLMSAEQIGQAWQERHSAQESGWNRAWIPLLDDGQDDLIVLDSASPGCAVRELWSGAADQPIVAPTLTAWLAEFVGEVEAGLYHEDPERGEFQRKN